MQLLNVLIVSREKSKYIKQIKDSKYLNKLYITSEEEIEDCVKITFNTFKELAKKCQILQIDIVLVEEEKWILEGITNVMKQFFINCFAPTGNWTELGLSHNYARKMLEKYNINLPPKITLPLEFPVLVKGDGVLRKANSMQDIIALKEQIFNTSPEIAKNVFLEEYINGEKYRVVSLFDGKHILTFPNGNIKQELLQDYSTKLEKMLTEEKANFTGFINSDLIEKDNILYNAGFNFGFVMPNLANCLNLQPKDFLFICLSAIYQKLNEINL